VVDVDRRSIPGVGCGSINAATTEQFCRAPNTASHILCRSICLWPSCSSMMRFTTPNRSNPGPALLPIAASGGPRILVSFEPGPGGKREIIHVTSVLH